MSGEEQSVLTERVERNTQDISELKDKTSGIPERMDNIEKQQEKLNNTIEKFIDELRVRYQTRENCQNCKVLIEQEIKTIKENSELNEINTKSRIDGIYKWVYGITGAGATTLLTIILKKIDLL